MRKIVLLSSLLVSVGTCSAFAHGHLASPPSTSNPADYQDGRYQHTVQAGKPFWIGNARSWNPECKSTGGTFRITQPPAHGRLSQDKVMGTIPEGREECSGRPTVLPRLFYTASPGYRGEDHVGYDVLFGNGGHRHIDEDLTVTGP